MKKLKDSQKYQVIDLFRQGYSYDVTGTKTGVSKGAGLHVDQYR